MTPESDIVAGAEEKAPRPAGISPLPASGQSLSDEGGGAAVYGALSRYLWQHTEPMDAESFREVSAFYGEYQGLVAELDMPARFHELADAAARADLDAFNDAAQVRLVVAGHDLKFMKELLPRLESTYRLRIDQWENHTKHDERASEDLLAWADLVWAEWLLGAAVWYSERLRPEQRMVVRAHRSEWGVAYGEHLRADRVDAFLTVSPHARSDFIDRFDLPASRTWMVPNSIEIDEYRQGDDPERVFSLAMVGALPKLKGLHKALELLSQLRDVDDRYTLTIYGKRPDELSWLTKISSEMEYFASCDELISASALQDAVVWAGWVNTREALADHGFVLSTSELEGFHIAPGEGFSSGGVGVFLDWRGVREIYPHEFIFDDVAAMRDYILELRDLERFEAAHKAGLAWLRRHYDTEVVWADARRVLSAVHQR